MSYLSPWMQWLHDTYFMLRFWIGVAAALWLLIMFGKFCWQELRPGKYNGPRKGDQP